MGRKLRSSEFLTIQGWMITKLHLTGMELVLFALIYSYSQDGNYLEWSAVDDFGSWFSAFGHELECEGIDYYINNLKMRGYVNVTKEGFAIVRHIKELKD